MGTGTSTANANVRVRSRHEEPSSPTTHLNNAIRRSSAQRRNKSNFVIPLIGCGGAGKSTLFKQFHVLFSEDFNLEDKKKWISAVRANCLMALHLILALMKDPDTNMLTVEPQNRDAAKRIVAIDDSMYLRMQTVWSESLAEQLLQVWNDQNVQKTFGLFRHKIDLENVEYNFEQLEKRIKHEDYIPSAQDIILNSKKTVGLHDAVYKLDQNYEITIWDSGGQRAERKKWHSLYKNSDLDYLIFMVSLSEYNQLCYEDFVTNRLQESLAIFEDLMSTPKLQNVTVILILNKLDVFAKKLQNDDLHIYFPDYTGGTDVQKGVQYIRQRFIDVVAKPTCMHEPVLYCFEGSMTNSADVKRILDSMIGGLCKPIFVNRSMDDLFNDLE